MSIRSLLLEEGMAPAIALGDLLFATAPFGVPADNSSIDDPDVAVEMKSDDASMRSTLTIAAEAAGMQTRAIDAPVPRSY